MGANLMITLFKTLVGSQAYGMATPSSDFDYKMVYIQSLEDILGFRYKPQIEFSKDYTGFEVQRFLELLRTANPTVLELLFSPENCTQEKHQVFDLIIDQRYKFLTKKCRFSFGKYAIAQIYKAKGLDKKMNWEKEDVSIKHPIDFCHIIIHGKTIPFTQWLEKEQVHESQIGLVNLDHAPDCYACYIQWHNSNKERYKGVFAKNSDFILTSSIPLGEEESGILVYNRNAYKIYQKRWESYQLWLKERNTARYVDSEKHGQKVDGKNLAHCVRLLRMAREIAEQGELKVFRPDYKELVDIRLGRVNLDDLLEDCLTKEQELDKIYEESNLPEEVEEDLVHQLLVSVRKSLYNHEFHE